MISDHFLALALCLAPTAPADKPAAPRVEFTAFKPGHDCACDGCQCGEPCPCPPGKPKAPAVPPQAPKAAALPLTRWRLTDANGQAWEHADPAYLQSFVTARNASLAARAATYYYAPAAASPCAGGRCPR